MYPLQKFNKFMFLRKKTTHGNAPPESICDMREERERVKDKTITIIYN